MLKQKYEIVVSVICRLLLLCVNNTKCEWVVQLLSGINLKGEKENKSEETHSTNLSVLVCHWWGFTGEERKVWFVLIDK